MRNQEMASDFVIVMPKKIPTAKKAIFFIVLFQLMVEGKNYPNISGISRCVMTRPPIKNPMTVISDDT